MGIKIKLFEIIFCIPQKLHYLCPRKHIKQEIMPELFRFYGFSFFFYSRIELTIEENKDIIISRWKEYFKI